MHTVINQQRSLFDSNITKDIRFRIEQLRKVKRVLQENEALLYESIYRDFRKSEFETYVSEIGLLYHEIDVFIRKTKKWSKRQIVSSGLANFPAKSYIIPEPLGVTLIIGAWNYPYQLSLIPAITALAAGNTVVLKPSELPEHTSKAMAHIINTNFPINYFHVIEGGVETTSQLLDIRFDKIFFTGSIPVGKIVYQAAAKHLTPVTLELGGKSPTFIFEDANLKITAKRIVWAAFLNAGQTCIAPDYIFVEKRIEQQLLEAIKHEIETNYPNNENINDNYTQIINTKNFDRLKALIDPKKIYYGGETNRDKRYISPTVLTNISFEDDIMKDEIFGPLLPVISFSNLNEAIAAVKSRPKPLSCYVYSKNKKTIAKLLNEISFGGGAINDSMMHISNSKLPFGGVGFSGFGSYHGKAGFDEFSHFKSVLHKTFLFEPNLKYAPYSPKKLTWIKWLLK